MHTRETGSIEEELELCVPGSSTSIDLTEDNCLHAIDLGRLEVSRA